MGNYISIDIGGTAIKYGLLDSNGTVLETGELKTQAAQGGSAVVSRVKELVQTHLSQTTLEGVCISTAGMVDCDKGEIFYAGPQMPGYTGVNWKKTIWETFALPCEVENDVNCAGLAETRSGAAQGSSVCLCLTVGTGIGGCAVIDGEVYHGFSGSACEIGYLQLSGGAFQDLASTTALVRNVAARRDGAPLNGKQIFELAQQGDPVCVKEIDRQVETLAIGISNICYVLNPQTVVMGGGIMKEKGYLAPRMQAALERHLLPALCEKTQLTFAQHQNMAGMLGAFYHFKQRQKGNGHV